MGVGTLILLWYDDSHIYLCIRMGGGSIELLGVGKGF